MNKLDPKVKGALEWICCIVIAMVIVLLGGYFIGKPTIVNQISMYPTLEQDQRLWLNRWGRTTHTLPNRGDIIIFRDFRKDLSKKINDTFFRKVNIYKSEEITPPIFNEEGVNFIFLKKNEVYIVIATLDNESPLYYFSILMQYFILF